MGQIYAPRRKLYYKSPSLGNVYQTFRKQGRERQVAFTTAHNHLLRNRERCNKVWTGTSGCL